MLRVSVECDVIPDDVLAKVNKAAEVSGKYLGRRYRQFTTLSAQKPVMRTIVSKATSLSLPDFVISLEIHEANPDQPNETTESKTALSPDKFPANNSPSNKLRYTAYERPRPSSKRRSRSSVSDAGSSRLSVDSHHAEDPMSKTMTAGELALMATGGALESVSRSPSRPRGEPKTLLASLDTPTSMSDMAPSSDLIALDSPFISDPTAPGNEPEQLSDFRSSWDAYESSNSRGWCEISVDNVVRRLQAMKFKLQVTASDETPFPGELKIIATQDNSVALLRLRESDDDESCLWRLRSGNGQLGIQIKRMLVED